MSGGTGFLPSTVSIYVPLYCLADLFKAQIDMKSSKASNFRSSEATLRLHDSLVIMRARSNFLLMFEDQFGLPMTIF